MTRHTPNNAIVDITTERPLLGKTLKHGYLFTTTSQTLSKNTQLPITITNLITEYVEIDSQAEALAHIQLWFIKTRSSVSFLKNNLAIMTLFLVLNCGLNASLVDWQSNARSVRSTFIGFTTFTNGIQILFMIAIMLMNLESCRGNKKTIYESIKTLEYGALLAESYSEYSSELSNTFLICCLCSLANGILS